MVELAAIEMTAPPAPDAPRIVQRAYRMKLEFNKLFDKRASKMLTEKKKARLEVHMREIYAELISLDLEAKAKELRKAVAGGVEIKMPASKFAAKNLLQSTKE